ncbi:hypothetical protein [Naasia aerilata]|nr:hypothetical protein [Naasia aerilata]
MPWYRRIPPVSWLVIAALVLAMAVFISQVVFSWAPEWVGFLALFVLAAGIVYSFRVIWKKSDHATFLRAARARAEVEAAACTAGWASVDGWNSGT